MFVFKYDGFILNMVIICNMDTQYNIWYLPSESYHVMSTNEKVSLLLIIMLIIVPLAPTVGALFTPNTILLHILSLFKNCCFFVYLKQNWKSLRRPLSQNIFNTFSDSHLLLKSTILKKTSNVRSNKHRINFALLAIALGISHICMSILKSRCFGKCYAKFFCHLVV